MRGRRLGSISWLRGSGPFDGLLYFVVHNGVRKIHRRYDPELVVAYERGQLERMRRHNAGGVMQSGGASWLPFFVQAVALRSCSPLAGAHSDMFTLCRPQE